MYTPAHMNAPTDIRASRTLDEIVRLLQVLDVQSSSIRVAAEQAQHALLTGPASTNAAKMPPPPEQSATPGDGLLPSLVVALSNLSMRLGTIDHMLHEIVKEVRLDG